MACFKVRWLERTVATGGGVLTWTEYPGRGRTFVGCTKLDGREIAPTDAHRLLVTVGHPAAELDCLGSGWGEHG